MKPVLIIIILALAAIIAIAMFDFRVTDSGSLPEVSVTGGDMPNATIRGPEVTMETEKQTFEVPTDVEVKTKTKSIEMPTDLEFELPEDTESKELVK